MSREPNNPFHRPIGSVVAAMMVMMTATAGWVIAIAIGGGDPYTAITLGSAIAASSFVLCWVIWKLTSVSSREVWSWVFSPQARPHCVYEVRKANLPQAIVENRPPTAAEIHEMKNDLRTWVPASPPREQPHR